MRRLSLFAGALVVTFFWFTAHAQAPLPVEFFTKYDEFGGVKISPDGQFIAVLTGKYGSSTLLFTDLKAKKNVGGIRTPEDCVIDEYHWVSPTRVIYTIAQRQRDNVTPTPTGEIFAIDRDGGSARQLYGYRAGQSTLDTHMQTRQASYATPVLLQVPR